MRYFALVTLLGLTACQSSLVPGTAPGSPGIVSRQVVAAATASLPAGTYLATVRPDLGAISYYSLSGSTARLIGEAYVRTGNCKISGALAEATLDRQNGIDFSVSCPSGLGFMQVPSGVIGSVEPTRIILTKFSANSTFLRGAIDSRGDVAIAVWASGPVKTVYHDVLMYGPNASGNIQPSYRVPLFTRGCHTHSTDKGPRKAWATGWQVAFADDDTLLVMVLPLTCGQEYIERFLPGSTALASWITPYLPPGNGMHRAAFFTNENLIPGRHGALLLGAFFMDSSKTGAGYGRNGAVEYSRDASGYEPLPQRTFADSRPSFGGKHFRQPAVVGIDAAGNAYLELQQASLANLGNGGYNRLAVFGPHANRTDRALRSIKVPDGELSYGNVIVSVTPPR